MIEDIIWTQGATADLQEIYNRLAEDNADELVSRIEASLVLLKAFPERAPKYKGSDVRRLLVSRDNRYGLFYTITGTRIIVAAVVRLDADPIALAKLIRSRTGA